MMGKIGRFYARWWVNASNRSHFIFSPVFHGYRYFSPNRISRAYARSRSRWL